MSEEFEALKEFITSSSTDMVELESLLTAKKALAPESGGDGELEKLEVLEDYLKKNGINRLERYDAKDSRVSSGIRPNLVATIPGNRDDYCIWLCAHLDVVPTGAMKLWDSDPWTVVQKDGKIYGRGVEDNQQGLVSAVFAALAFVKQHIIPEHTIKLLFMADEECGSAYGMQYLVREHLDIFGKNDRILIPDGGDANGETIEIAEKNIFWLRFRTIGKQAHGSRPDQGNNATLAASDLALRIHSLEKHFDRRDPLFDPPYSTFQPTMREANVSSVNIIPGEDVMYADCRINPCYSLDEVRKEVSRIVKEVEERYSVKIEVSEVQAESSTPTPQNAPVVKDLAEALKAVHGIDARCVGIGGGTVGAYLRNAGYDCVVWSSLDETAHQPNEYAIISNIIKDAETIAYMAARP
ncbi:MAG: M20 family metallo-hydrolase [Treponema sp.]|nr:M20 family metallo-hydrolase [Treponema sp.]MCR5621276.1 M20 family metallo-hydrolase [Treponema sp.]